MKVGVAAILVLLGTFAGLVAGKALPASASTLNAVATFATPGTDKPLAKGGSTTPFTVTLPKNAPPPLHRGHRQEGLHRLQLPGPPGNQSHLGQLLGRVPVAGYGLVAPPHTYYGAANTAQGTGEIIGIPNNLEWGPLVTSFGVPLKSLLYAGGKSGAVGSRCGLRQEWRRHRLLERRRHLHLQHHRSQQVRLGRYAGPVQGRLSRRVLYGDQGHVHGSVRQDQLAHRGVGRLPGPDHHRDRQAPGRGGLQDGWPTHRRPDGGRDLQDHFSAKIGTEKRPPRPSP